MKILLFSFIFTTFSLANYSYSYGEEKGKIDMHGGKSEKLNTYGGVSKSLDLSTQLKELPKDKKKEELKKNFEKKSKEKAKEE